MGKCVEKDPNAGILDKFCRDVAGADTISGSGGDYANGYGFCGLAAYYNNSAPQDGIENGNVIAPVAGAVRRVHWSGVCIAGVCKECDPNSNAWYGNGQSQQGKTCVNGYIRSTITTDGTVHTLHLNSAAIAAIIAATFIIVLVIGFYLYSVYDANRHRAMFGKGPMTCVETLAETFCVWQCCMCCCKQELHMNGVQTRSVGGGDANGVGASTQNPVVTDWAGSSARRSSETAGGASHPALQSSKQARLIGDQSQFTAVPGAVPPTGGYGATA